MFFSDKKHFNLEKSYGHKYVWQDILRESASVFSGRNGGERIIVWAAFSAKGKADLALTTSTLNTKMYGTILKNIFYPLRTVSTVKVSFLCKIMLPYIVAGI